MNDGYVFQLMTQEIFSIGFTPQNTQLSLTASLLPALANNEIRVQVLYSGISADDLTLIEGRDIHQHFGVQVIGRVVAVGSGVGARKVGQIVGVYRSNVKRGQSRSGFSTYLQVPADEIVFIPTTISLPQAASLLSTGVVAYRSLLHSAKHSPIAIVGSNHLSYLAVQFAKKYFDLKVTLFISEGSDTTDFGADNVETLSLDSIKKFQQKFDRVIITESLKPDVAKAIQNLAIRTGKVFFGASFSYHSEITVFQLIVCQRQLIGVKRGQVEHTIKMLDIAAFKGIRGKVDVVAWKEFSSAFEKAKHSGKSVVLDFQH